MHIVIIKKSFIKKSILIGSLILVAVLAAIGYNLKNASVFNKEKKLPIYCVDTNEKKIAISFDASWGANNTVKLLDILDKYKVKATFFLVGRWVDEFPNETKEIFKRGHEIGNHSNKHPNMTNISKKRMIDEIAETDAKLMAVTGKKTELFRCPEGAYNDTVLNTVEESNHYCIQWDVDSIDWKNEDADKEYNRVMKKVKPGSIVLFHNSAKYTPTTLPKIIEKLKGEGYEFVKISDLIYKDNYSIDHEGKQIKNDTLNKK